MRIFFTGGSGKAGRHVAPYLAEQGHHVTNADLVPLGHPAVADLRVDLTDAGETYSALAGLATFDELDLPEKPTYDAVVHFAAVPRILLTSDAATYATNVLSTYNVLEAATRLGVRKIVFASSETTYGICFAQGERRPLYVPVDEEHPTVPEDAYAMSKVAGEVTARSFQARTGADVYGLRINNVIEPHEYAEMFPAFLADPSLRRRNVFAYIDARDLGQMVQRCLETDGLGYEVFNVANADMSVAATTQEIRDRFYDGVEVRREMGRDETFYAIDKARDLLGFAPQHSWRDVLPDPGAGRSRLQGLTHVADVGLRLLPRLGQVTSEDESSGGQREPLDLLDRGVRRHATCTDGRSAAICGPRRDVSQRFAGSLLRDPPMAQQRASTSGRTAGRSRGRRC